MAKLKQIAKPYLIYPAILAVVVIMFLLSRISDNQPIDRSTDNSTQSINQSSVDNQPEYSLDDPASIWVVVNKQRSIPIDYSPKLITPNVPLTMDSAIENMKLSSSIQAATEKLFTEASKQGIKLRLGSGYRSADTQTGLYNGYVSTQGQAEADKYSARPGHSEHQTGLAIDIVSNDNYCFMEDCWANTNEGRWLANNAHLHGFIIRYPKDKQSITGYHYEPWHIRYVGKELSTKLYQTGQTMEEYFKLGPANEYKTSQD